VTDVTHLTDKAGLTTTDPTLASRGVAPTPATTAGLVRPIVKASRGRSRRATLALRAVLPAAIFGLWWLLTGTGVIPGTQLSTPAATWHAFVFLLFHQDLLGDIGISAARAGVGLLIGGGVGLILGVVVGLFALGEEILDSSLQMFRTLPYPAFIFLFIIWFGIGENAKVLLIALATLTPMYLNASNGVRNVDRRVVEAARTFGLRGWRLVRQVIIPLALPSILNGMRFAAGISVVALVFAEAIAASLGIGALVFQASNLQQVPTLVVCIIIYALLGISADILVRTIERFSMPWRRHLAVR
jgi:sulfonate transport system permease protein